MKRLSTTWMFACALLLVASVPSAVSAADIEWLDKTQDALQLAAETDRPVMVDLWAVWCRPCKEMEETTYADPRVHRALRQFVPLKIDADADTLFTRRYEVEAFPTTMFLDAEGREIARIEGYLGSDELLDRLDEVSRGYADYLTHRSATNDPSATAFAARYLLDVGNPEGALSLCRRALKPLRKAGGVECERIELLIANALYDTGRRGPATKEFERLADSATDRDARGEALVSLIRAQEELGDHDRVRENLVKLEEEYPEIAAGTEVGVVQPVSGR